MTEERLRLEVDILIDAFPPKDKLTREVLVYEIMKRANQYALTKKSELKRYDLTFGNYCKVGIEVCNNEIKVIGAMNGYGDSIMDDLAIENLAPEPEEEE